MLYPRVFIGRDAVVGEASILYPCVTVYRRCLIGRRVVLHAGVVVGSAGFGFARPGQENIKIPQVGHVQIDDDVEIGANTTIDRGALGRTWIQRGVKIDNLVQIAHNVVIGEYSVIVAQVGISGSTQLGKGVVVGGQAVSSATSGSGIMSWWPPGRGSTKTSLRSRSPPGRPTCPTGNGLSWRLASRSCRRCGGPSPP